MKHIIFLFIVIFCIFGGGNISANGQNANNKKTVKFLSISQINEKKLVSEVVQTEGFVVKIFRCPPCPPDANCKTCMEDNAVVSMENNLLESYADLTAKELIIFGNETGELEKGKKYRFAIRITDRKTTGQASNDVEMINYKSVK